MLILKTRAKKYTPKKLKNQLRLYLHRRKNPTKINTIKEEFYARTFPKVANSIFTLDSISQRPPETKLGH